MTAFDEGNLENPANVYRWARAETARLLEERGVLRATANELVARHSERLHVSSAGRVIVAAEGGTFYTGDDALEMLAAELYEVVPEDARSGRGTEGDLVSRAAERFQRQRDQRGVNPLLRGSTP